MVLWYLMRNTSLAPVSAKQKHRFFFSTWWTISFWGFNIIYSIDISGSNQSVDFLGTISMEAGSCMHTVGHRNAIFSGKQANSLCPLFGCWFTLEWESPFSQDCVILIAFGDIFHYLTDLISLCLLPQQQESAVTEPLCFCCSAFNPLHFLKRKENESLFPLSFVLCFQFMLKTAVNPILLTPGLQRRRALLINSNEHQTVSSSLSALGQGLLLSPSFSFLDQISPKLN